MPDSEHVPSSGRKDANWVSKTGGLPEYINRIAKDLMDKGMPESEAIATAVNTVKRWARGGGKVKPDTRAKAAAALAEWEAKKAASHTSLSTPTRLGFSRHGRVRVVDLAAVLDRTAQIADPGARAAARLKVLDLAITHKTPVGVAAGGGAVASGRSYSLDELATKRAKFLARAAAKAKRGAKAAGSRKTKKSAGRKSKSKYVKPPKKVAPITAAGLPKWSHGWVPQNDAARAAVKKNPQKYAQMRAGQRPAGRSVANLSADIEAVLIDLADGQVAFNIEKVRDAYNARESKRRQAAYEKQRQQRALNPTADLPGPVLEPRYRYPKEVWNTHLIVKGENETDLFKVPYEVGADGVTVTFGKEVPVTHQYVELSHADESDLIAEWDASGCLIMTIDLADAKPGQRFRHGWIPINSSVGKALRATAKAPAKKSTPRVAGRSRKDLVDGLTKQGHRDRSERLVAIPRSERTPEQHLQFARSNAVLRGQTPPTKMVLPTGPAAAASTAGTLKDAQDRRIRKATKGAMRPPEQGGVGATGTPKPTRLSTLSPSDRLSGVHVETHLGHQIQVQRHQTKNGFLKVSIGGVLHDTPIGRTNADAQKHINAAKATLNDVIARPDAYHNGLGEYSFHHSGKMPKEMQAAVEAHKAASALPGGQTAGSTGGMTDKAATHKHNAAIAQVYKRFEEVDPSKEQSLMQHHDRLHTQRGQDLWPGLTGEAARSRSVQDWQMRSGSVKVGVNWKKPDWYTGPHPTVTRQGEKISDLPMERLSHMLRHGDAKAKEDARVEAVTRKNAEMGRAADGVTPLTSSLPAVGSTVTTRVHSIGGRSELVTGKVTGHQRGAVIVQTESGHGTLAIEPAKIESVTASGSTSTQGGGPAFERKTFKGHGIKHGDPIEIRDGSKTHTGTAYVSGSSVGVLTSDGVPKIMGGTATKVHARKIDKAPPMDGPAHPLAYTTGTTTGASGTTLHHAIGRDGKPAHSGGYATKEKAQAIADRIRPPHEASFERGLAKTEAKNAAADAKAASKQAADEIGRTMGSVHPEKFKPGEKPPVHKFMNTQRLQEIANGDHPEHAAMAKEILRRRGKSGPAADPAAGGLSSSNPASKAMTERIRANRVKNAETMYGTGSPQHLEAQRRFGSTDTTPARAAIDRMSQAARDAAAPTAPKRGPKVSIGNKTLPEGMTVHKSDRTDYKGSPILELHHPEHGHLADLVKGETRTPILARGQRYSVGESVQKGYDYTLTKNALEKAGRPDLKGSAASSVSHRPLAQAAGDAHNSLRLMGLGKPKDAPATPGSSNAQFALRQTIYEKMPELKGKSALELHQMRRLLENQARATGSLATVAPRLAMIDRLLRIL